MSEKLRDLLRTLRAGLECLYGARLKGVFLYGSHARGNAEPDSDVDVLIVLDRVRNYSDEIDRTSELISGLSLECGLTISRVFASEARWETDQSNFFLNVREEAVAA